MVPPRGANAQGHHIQSPQQRGATPGQQCMHHMVSAGALSNQEEYLERATPTHGEWALPTPWEGKDQ